VTQRKPTPSCTAESRARGTQLYSMRGRPWTAPLIWRRIGQNATRWAKKIPNASSVPAEVVTVRARFGTRFGERGGISPAAPPSAPSRDIALQCPAGQWTMRWPKARLVCSKPKSSTFRAPGKPCPGRMGNPEMGELVQHPPLMVCEGHRGLWPGRAAERLHNAIGYVTPLKAEEAFHANMNDPDKVA
jgi:hypothetical protein